MPRVFGKKGQVAVFIGGARLVKSPSSPVPPVANVPRLPKPFPVPERVPEGNIEILHIESAAPHLNSAQSTGKSDSPRSKIASAVAAAAAAPVAEQEFERKKDMHFVVNIEEIIGQGGFGKVVKGYDPQGNAVAVKVVPCPPTASDAMLKSLLREVEVMKRLEHPNIVRYLRVDHEGSQIRIFMEFVAGGTIDELISKKKGVGLDEEIVRTLTRGILIGLNYLHYSGVAHRDIKGANVLVENMRVVKLADFGVAKFVSDLSGSAARSGLVGTPRWMAPEAVRGKSVKASDIWSVGATVLHMVTGELPWSHVDNQVTIMFKISNGEHPAISGSVNDICRDFLLQCFMKDVGARPKASDLLCHLYLSSHLRSGREILRTAENATENPPVKRAESPQSSEFQFSETIGRTFNGTVARPDPLLLGVAGSDGKKIFRKSSEGADGDKQGTVTESSALSGFTSGSRIFRDSSGESDSTKISTKNPATARQEISVENSAGARLSQSGSSSENMHVCVLVVAPIRFDITNDQEDSTVSFSVSVDEYSVGGGGGGEEDSDCESWGMEGLANDTDCISQIQTISQLFRRTEFPFSFSIFAGPTPDTLADAVSLKSTVLHITGQNSAGGLVVEDGRGGISIVSAEGLRRALARGRYLNGNPSRAGGSTAMSVGSSDEGSPQVSLAVIIGDFAEISADVFLAAGIPFVVAVSAPNSSSYAADTFLTAFYKSFFMTGDPSAAVESGELAMQLNSDGEAPADVSLFVSDASPLSPPLFTFENITVGIPRDISKPLPTVLLPTPQSNFVGREREMHSIISSVAKFRVTTITGAPGIGKSRLAIAIGYFFHHRRFFKDGIIFINLNGLNVSAVPFAIAKSLNVCVETKQEALAALREKHMLIIIDRCEQTDTERVGEFNSVIDSIVSCAPQVHLMLTSRMSVAGSVCPCRTIVIGCLPLPIAVSLIKSVAQTHIDSADAVALAKICGCLPLALRVVGRALGNARGLFTTADLIKKLKNEKGRLKALKQIPLGEGENIEACIRSSYDIINENMKTNFRALSIFPGSFDLSAASTVLADTEGTDGDTDSEWEVRSSLFHLVECSLIEFDAATSRFYLHELVRVFAANEAELPGNIHAREEQRRRLIVHVCGLLVGATKRYKEHSSLDLFDTDRHNIDLAVRIASAHTTQLTPALHSQLLVSARLLFRVRMEPAERMRIYSECLSALRKQERSSEETETHILNESLIISELGYTFVDQSKIEEGIKYYREAISLQEKYNLTETHQHVELLSLLGCAYDFARRPDDTEKTLLHALEKSRKMLGGDHPQTAQIMNNLANTYSFSPNVPAAKSLTAENLHREVLGIRTRVLGPHHVDVAQSLHNLALFLSKKCSRLRLEGDELAKTIEEAENCFVASLEIRRHVLGCTHPSVAATLNSLGNLCRLQKGEFARAERLLREGLHLREQFFGETSAKVAESQSNLASLLAATGSYNEAERLMRSSLQLYENITEKPSAREVAKLEFELATIVEAQGREEEATQIFQTYKDFKRKNNLRPLPHEKAFHEIIVVSSIIFNEKKGKILRQLEERYMCSIGIQREEQEGAISIKIMGRSREIVGAALSEFQKLLDTESSSRRSAHRNRGLNSRGSGGLRSDRPAASLGDFLVDRRLSGGGRGGGVAATRVGRGGAGGGGRSGTSPPSRRLNPTENSQIEKWPSLSGSVQNVSPPSSRQDSATGSGPNPDPPIWGPKARAAPSPDLSGPKPVAATTAAGGSPRQIFNGPNPHSAAAGGGAPTNSRQFTRKNNGAESSPRQTESSSSAPRRPPAQQQHRTTRQPLRPPPPSDETIWPSLK